VGIFSEHSVLCQRTVHFVNGLFAIIIMLIYTHWLPREDSGFLVFSWQPLQWWSNIKPIV